MNKLKYLILKIPESLIQVAQLTMLKVLKEVFLKSDLYSNLGGIKGLVLLNNLFMADQRPSLFKGPL